MAEKRVKNEAEVHSEPVLPSQGEAPNPESGSRYSSGRRRFLKGAGIAAPAVILTVSSKPVLARHCTVSGTLSGNLSHQDYDHYCSGRAPGYWRTHPDDWPYPYTAGDCVSTSPGGMCNEYVNGTPFHSTYVNAASQRGPFSGYLYGDATMLEVLEMSVLDSRYQLGAHAVAALLNALYFGQESFGYTEGQIIDMWDARHLVDPEGLREDLELLNTRGE